MRLWQRLPLSVQLGILAVTVLTIWFLAARFITAHQEESGDERQLSHEQLHIGEVAATRLGTDLAALQSSLNSTIVHGSENEIARLNAAKQGFDLTLAMLSRRSTGGTMRISADYLSKIADEWYYDAALPAVELRLHQNISAFNENQVGAALLSRGLTLMREAEALQQSLLRESKELTISSLADMEQATASKELETIMVQATAVLILLLIGFMILRRVSGALSQINDAAAALEEGNYADARLPDVQKAPNRDIAQLATSFGRLAESMAARENLLHEDIEELKELERLKADFVSTVSHELRTPLTSMRGAIGLILGGKVGEISPRGRELLQIAMSNTERLIRLINDILDIEKMDAGQMSIRRDRVRIRTVVASTIAGLDGLAREAKVNVRLAADGDAEVMGDADRLVQVLTNLMSNAIKFSPAESEIEVGVVPEEDTVSVFVRDKGPGISKEFADRIFGRFQQEGGAENRQSGGTGLGLNIAKSIVEMHGGKIGFEPGTEGGTVFWFNLPVVATTRQSAEAQGEQDVLVLVVEDDSAMREVLLAQIDAFAHAIPAHSAEEALEILSKESVSAIVLDSILPGMNGFELARLLRKDPNHRTLPILLFTAREYTTEELRVEGVRAVDAYVKSRDSEEALLDRLRTEVRKGGAAVSASRR